MNHTLCFIGGGNMARSLIGGLLARGMRAEQIVVADPVGAQLDALKSDYGIRIAQSNSAAAHGADVVVLAVKPQELRTVAAELRDGLESGGTLLISVAAGIRAADIQRWSGCAAVVRCMPNRPALVGCGVTGLFATAAVSADRRRIAEAILKAVGETLWLEREADMDAVTAISGSGPAYFFLLIEMLEQGGVALGLTPDVSRTLAVETAFGAGSMARTATQSAAVLRAQVTSAGGTTEAALRHLEAHNVRRIFQEAIAAAARRSTELADALGAS
jgi:pyrroline-5-carboxylate reductase